MDINDIIVLANAGYTKADITALLGAQTQAQVPAQTQAQVPAQIPAQVPVPAPAPAPPTANVPVYAPSPIPVPVQTQQQAPAQDDSINKMLAEMSLLRQDLQTNNIINSQQPKVETADDIIAKIINPPIVKKEG